MTVISGGLGECGAFHANAIVHREPHETSWRDAGFGMFVLR